MGCALVSVELDYMLAHPIRQTWKLVLPFTDRGLVGLSHIPYKQLAFGHWLVT